MQIVIEKYMEVSSNEYLPFLIFQPYRVMKKILSLLHIHIFNTPITSEYISFNTRNIIYQCRCGCKKSYNVTMPFGVSFPIQTSSFLTQKEFKKILKDTNPMKPLLTPQEELDYLVNQS